MANPLLGGRYQVIRQLGGGGFGQTFLAEDQHLPGRPFCVIKHLRPKVDQPETIAAAQRLFEVEAAVLHELGHHDQIPRLAAYFQENDEFYIVEEFIQGTLFRQELQQRRVISELEVLDWLLEILIVLEFVHLHQVIHRDIKPANLIRRQLDGKIVLIDFGAVKQLVTPSWLAETPSLNFALGSSGYAPPEQLAGKACFASDLYAVGMIAIQALTGIAPNQLPTDPDCHEVQWRDRVQVNSTLANVIDRMVRYDFHQRYQSTSEVLTDLQTLNREVIQANQSDDASFMWLERGDVLFQQQSHRQALAAYDAAIQRNPLSPIAWLKRGVTLDALDQAATALTCYDRAVQLAPENTDAWSKRGLVLENLGRPEAALASYRKVIEIDGQHYWSWYDQGRVLESLDQLEVALNAYQRALEINPHFQMAITSRKRLLIELRRLDDLLKFEHYDAGLVVADTLLEENPENGQAWFAQGIALARQQQFEAALTALDLALDLQPEQLPVQFERGQVLAALGRNTAALSCYDGIIQQQAKHSLAWLGRAQILEKMHQDTAAMHAYNRAMELEHSLIEAQQGRLRMREKLASAAPGDSAAGNHDVIKVIWNGEPTAIHAIPSVADSPITTPTTVTHSDTPLVGEKLMTSPLNWMIQPSISSAAQQSTHANLLSKLQKHRQTVASNNQSNKSLKSLQLDSNSPEVLEWRGNLCVALGRYEAAITAYNEAIQVMPENANLWCCLAGALLKLKRPHESIECFDRAIGLKPQNHTPWYWRGRAFIDLKQFPAAIESLEKSLALNPDFQPAKHDLEQLQQKLTSPNRPLASINRT